MALRDFFPSNLGKKISQLFSHNKNLTETIDELEEILVLADISVETVAKLLDSLRKKVGHSWVHQDFLDFLKKEMLNLLAEVPATAMKLSGRHDTILLAGINGSGKTTTAAKMAYYYGLKGKKVLLAASDTFRAAGSSQLSLWGQRLNIPVIGGDRGADPGSVVYNSLQSLIHRDYDILVIDTAGRVQTRENLMKELEKIVRIVQKQLPDQPCETLLVIDGTMGQNTMDQALKFHQFSGISGIVLAKMDGTAKGGTVINIMDQLKIPVKFIGYGETEKDLLPFDRCEFVDALLASEI